MNNKQPFSLFIYFTPLATKARRILIFTKLLDNFQFWICDREAKQKKVQRGAIFEKRCSF